MAALTKFRKLTAIAPGLTVRARRVSYSNYAPPVEQVEMKGNIQSFDIREATRLRVWLNGWAEAVEKDYGGAAREAR